MLVSTTPRLCVCTRSDLRPLGFSIPYAVPDGAYRRYTGDASVPGKGEILLWQPNAS